MSEVFHTTWARAVLPGKSFGLLHLHKCNSQCNQNFSRLENAGFMKAEWHSLYTVGIIPLCISVNFNFFGVVDLSQFSNGNTDPRIVNLNYNTSILGFYSPIFEDVSEAFNKSPEVCGVTVWKPLHRRLLIEEIIASLRCDRYRSLSLFCRAQSNLSFVSLLFVAAITLEEQDSRSITKQA